MFIAESPVKLAPLVNTPCRHILAIFHLCLLMCLYTRQLMVLIFLQHLLRAMNLSTCSYVIFFEGKLEAAHPFTEGTCLTRAIGGTGSSFRDIGLNMLFVADWQYYIENEIMKMIMRYCKIANRFAP